MNSHRLFFNHDLTSIKNNDVALCVQCGRCKASCPTYIESSTEVLGARGRVAILKKFIHGEIIASDRLYESIFSCILCEACNKECPLNIDIANAVYKSRKSLKNFNKKTVLLSYLMGYVLKNPLTTLKVLKILKIISDIPKVGEIRPFRYLKKLGIKPADKPFRDESTVFRSSNPAGRVAVFAGCAVNCLTPSYGKTLINMLNDLRYDVILPSGEVCCGAPLLELGLEEECIKLAKRNIETFNSLNVEAVISLCPTCIHFIKNIYPKYLGDCIENSLDISQFLTSKAPAYQELMKYYKRTTLLVNPESKIIYHDPCHCKYSLNIFLEPRSILKQAGINLIDPISSGCCGFGGAFGLFFEGLSDNILQSRVESYKNADTIITSCPNCILQMKSKMKNKQVYHIIDVIGNIITKENE